MKMNKIIIYAGIVLTVAVVSFSLFMKFGWNGGSSVSLAKEIEDDYAGIDKIVQERVKDQSQVAMSSNPYDYIENNEHYDSLISKGVEALPILEEKLADDEYQDGLMAYVTAMAIEDISGCDTHANQNATWSTAEEFMQYWEKFTKNADKEVQEIVKSNASDEKKIDEMKKYGIFSVPAMQNMEDGKLNKKTLEKKKRALKSCGISSNDRTTLKKIKKYIQARTE